MNNTTNTCRQFSDKLNTAAANTSAFRKVILSTFCLAVLLMSTTSCSRNIGAGCGTWPTIKINKDQYRGDYRTMKGKNDKPFANYKRYN